MGFPMRKWAARFKTILSLPQRQGLIGKAAGSDYHVEYGEAKNPNGCGGARRYGIVERR